MFMCKQNMPRSVTECTRQHCAVFSNVFGSSIELFANHESVYGQELHALAGRKSISAAALNSPSLRSLGGG
jgi:hypothetical protein